MTAGVKPLIDQYITPLLIGFCLLMFAGCGQEHHDPNVLKVGTIAGPETTLMETAQQVAKERYGLNIKIIQFSDYVMPNIALSEGSIDANMIQHLPYLKAAIKAKGFKLTPVAKTFIYPMGLYSKAYKTLGEIPVGASVIIPNDPSNEARALLLLQDAGLIKLKPHSDITATLQDITQNTKKLKIVALSAAEIPRALDDAALAAINTNFAMLVGLTPSKNALFHESSRSPYANILVVQDKNKDNPKIKQLIKALHSEAVLKEAKSLFRGEAIPAWQ